MLSDIILIVSALSTKFTWYFQTFTLSASEACSKIYCDPLEIEFLLRLAKQAKLEVNLDTPTSSAVNIALICP